MPKSETDAPEIENENPVVKSEDEADLAEEHAEKAEIVAKKAEESAEAGHDVADDAAKMAQAVRFEGEPNGMAPVAVAHVEYEPSKRVKTLHEWFHTHIDGDEVHARDASHRNSLYRMMETMVAQIQNKEVAELHAKND